MEHNDPRRFFSCVSIKCLLASSHPEMVLLPNLFVNLRSCLCLPVPARQTGDVPQYVSAQALVFLDLEQKSSFPIWKLHSGHPAFPDGHWQKSEL
jgi:hypothetical protein